MATYDIKRTNGSVEWLVKTVKPSGSQTREAMGVDVVDMAFTLPVFTEFRIGDFVTVYGRKYKLNVSPTVERKAKRHFDYTIQFEAEWYDLAKVQLQFLNPQNQLLEPVFSLMGNASTIVGLIVENANRHSPGWTVGVVDETDYRNFTFNAQNCLQALHELAGTFQTEFWIDNKTIHLQKREQASGVTFEYGKGNGLYNIRRSNKNSANILTRLYVRGGSTNLPSGYGSNSLLLPGGATYIQDAGKVDMYGLIEATQIFPDIFPKREGTVTGVTAGAGNWKYFTDSGMDFDLNDQFAPGLDKGKITFNTGQLAGYTFNIADYNHATKTFTINKNTDETALDVPSDLLRPAVGDKYVLIDIIMPETYVTEAQNKLASAGQAYYDKNSDPLFLLDYSASCDPMFIKQNAVDVQLGNTAVLYDNEMGLNVELRIAKYVRDLQEADKYNDVVWSDTIGANEIVRQYQQQQKTLLLLESSGLLDINQLRKNLFLNRLSEQDGYLMLSGTKVKAGHADFAIDAQHADVASYALNSDQWDGRDFADYLDQPVRTTDDVRFKSITSTSFVSGAAGSGWQVDEAGNATFDNLTVRKEFNVYELVLNKISGTNGALAVTDTIKIDTVTETSTGYDCTIDTGNDTVAVPFQVNDLVRCQVWNGSAVKYYFAKVTAVGNGTFTLDKATKDGAGVPAAGDTVVRFGNTTNANRQGLLYLTASDDGAPYLDVLDGVTSSDLTGKTKVRLGKLNGIVDPDFGALAGYGLYGENVYLKDGHFKGVVEVTGGNAETTSGAQSKADTAQAAAILAAANDATNKVNAVQVGGRNLFSLKQALNVFDVTQNSFRHFGWATPILGNSWVYENLRQNEEYTFSCEFTVEQTSALPVFSKDVQINLYNWGTGQQIGMLYSNNYTVGAINLFKGTFVIPYDVSAGNWEILGYTGRYTDGVSVEYGRVLFKNVQLELGNKATDWSPNPADVAADISAADTKAQNAQNAHNSLVASLKSLAYEDIVELSKLGTTVIENGMLKNTLVDTVFLQAEIANVDYLNGLEYDFTQGTVDRLKARVINAQQIVVEGGGRKNLLYPEKLQVSSNPSQIASADWEGFASSLNGDTTENAIVLGTDPFGQQSVLWKCIEMNGGDQGGGFHSLPFPVDPNKTYRFSIFLKRTPTSSGSYYWGCSTDGSTWDIGGTGNNNPYFHYGSGLLDSKWYLFTGYIHPASQAVQLNLSAVYSVETGEKVSIGTDYRHNQFAPAQYMRAYQYYSNNGSEQYFFSPRVDIVDGTEPTINELLAGGAVAMGKLGVLIENGKIKTNLLDAEYIKTYIVNAQYIQALDIVATTVAADTGTIGGWELSSTALQSSAKGYGSAPKMSINSSSGEISMQGDSLGEASYLASDGLLMIAGEGRYVTTLQSDVAGYFRINGDPLQFYRETKAALVSSVYGGYGYAARLLGMVQIGGGLVLPAKVLTTGVSYYFTDSDYYVMADHGMTIYLPSNPIDGRVAIVAKNTSQSVTVNGNGTNIKYRNETPVSSKVIEWNLMFIYINGYWQLMFFMA